jgi:periplasmic divalent cation tolerance protein
MTRDKIVVLVTCGTASEAERIARELVKRRLAACVNLLESPVRSIYRWRGKVENAPEYLLMVKTSRKRLAELQREVERLHSYDVPEVIALPIAAGSEKYLAWLDEIVKLDRAGSRRRKGAGEAPSPPEADAMKPLDLLPGEVVKKT